ncbi:MAG: DNA-3-methyladenine glycosylase I [Anaerolineae bacterium]|nr:DNA-3-methyladenine glycosylase I [Anaerolineae bacterium]
MQAYHDQQWGVPVHDDRMLFEMLSLEGAQAGLSWRSILQRRAAYQELFDNFEPEIVACYDEARIAALLGDARIIRNRGKIRSVVSNAQAFLQVQAEYGSFDRYLWAFVDGEARLNCFQRMEDVPAETEESRGLAADLKGRGFRFVGPTICYAWMQSCGLVNDHVAGCFRYRC